MPCSNAAKTQNPLKFVGVPQTPEPISAASMPKFTILSGHVEEVLLLNKFFRLSIHALVAKIWPDKVVRWCQDDDFLRPVFAASRVQRISDLHSKFALRPHHVPKYIQCRSEMCCTRLAKIQDAKIRHLGTIAQIFMAISSQLRHISTIGKKTC